MSKTLTIAVLAILAAALFVTGAPAQADTLHGFCSVPADCKVDLNLGGGLSGTTFSPGTAQFGFYAAPGPLSGTDYLVILSPTLLAGAPTLTETNVAGSPPTTTSFVGAWSSGGLDDLLGLDATANNPFGNYGGPNGIDAGATKLYVYEVNLGSQILQPQSNEGSGPLFSVNGGLAAGDFVLDFLSPPGGVNAEQRRAFGYEHGFYT